MEAKVASTVFSRIKKTLLSLLPLALFFLLSSLIGRGQGRGVVGVLECRVRQWAVVQWERGEVRDGRGDRKGWREDRGVDWIEEEMERRV